MTANAVAETAPTAQKRSFLPTLTRSDPPPPKPTAAGEQITSLLAEGSEQIGNLSLKDGIKLLGKLRGDLTVQNQSALVLIETQAVVEGTIDAGRVYIRGKVYGTIKAKHVILQSSALVDGEIHYERLEIADGAEIIGTVHKHKKPEFSPESAIQHEPEKRVVPITG